jgi:phosphatidylglycerol:prolipoprotein diacylglycerol transferase
MLLPSTVYIHNLDPIALSIPLGFTTVLIRWYALSYITGFFLGYLIIRWMAQRGRSQLTVLQASDFVFQVALGTIVGGRLGYCLFYAPELFLDFSGQLPFWGPLAIHKGGMASHGGIVGIVVSCLLYARRFNISSWHLMDLTTLGGAAGVFFGRIANFINGELVGRPVQSSVPWAVKFPQDILLWPSYEPARLPALGPIVQQIGVQPEQWQNLVRRAYADQGAFNSLGQILDKLLLRIQHGDSALSQALAPLLDARHPSQIYEALLEGLLVFVVLALIWRRPRKAGVITGCFFCIYAVVRIIGEQFRMPDAHIGLQLFDLTRGQWLSLAMLLLGLALLRYTTRRDAPRLGGWGAAGA